MGQPAEPTPGAPAEPATPPAPAPPAGPAAAPQPSQPTPGQVPPWERDGQPFDPAKAWSMIQGLKAEVDKSRTGAKAAAAEEARKEMAAKVAKALGLGDEPPDPAVLLGQVEEARNAAWANAVELQVFRLAAAAGADPDKLLDSRSFIDTLDDLVDLDPGGEEFRTKLKAKVQEAAAKYPAAPGAPGGPRPDPSQGARGNQPARPTSLGQALAAHYAAKKT